MAADAAETLAPSKGDPISNADDITHGIQSLSINNQEVEVEEQQVPSYVARLLTPLDNLPPLDAKTLTNLAKAPATTITVDYTSPKQEPQSNNHVHYVEWDQVARVSRTNDDSTGTNATSRTLKCHIATITPGEHRVLTQQGSTSTTGTTSKTIEMRIRFTGTDPSTSMFPYDAGESVALWPHNDTEVVDALLNRLLGGTNSKDSNKKEALIKAQSHVSIFDVTSETDDEPARKSHDCSSWAVDVTGARGGRGATLHDIFKYVVGLHGMVKKKVLRILAESTSTPAERQYLLFLCSKQGSKAYTSLQSRGDMHLLRLLSTFPSCNPPVEALVEHLDHIKPRYYTMIDPYDVSLQQGYIRVAFNSMNSEDVDLVHHATPPLETTILSRLSGHSSPKKDITSISPVQVPVALELRPAFNVFAMTPERLNMLVTTDGTQARLLLVANGIGLAPMVAVLKAIENKYNTLKLTNEDAKRPSTWLIHGRRSIEEDAIFDDEVSSLVSSGLVTKYTSCISRASPDEESIIAGSPLQNSDSAIEYFSGRVTDLLSSIPPGSPQESRLLSHVSPQTNTKLVMVCGTPAMAREVQLCIGRTIVTNSQDTEDASVDKAASKAAGQMVQEGSYVFSAA